MKYDTDVIKSTLSAYFADFLVEDLMKELKEAQKNVNALRRAKIESFIKGESE